MIMITVEKREFGQLSDKRYVFLDGICSLPYRHRDLRPLMEFENNLKLSPQNL